MVFFIFCYCKECCSENWCTNVWVHIFNIFGCLSWNGIAGSSVNSMCNFWSNYQTLFHSYGSVLHFHKGSSFSSTLVIIYLFFIIAILVSHSHAVSDVKWYLIVSFCFVCGECVCVCLRFVDLWLPGSLLLRLGFAASGSYSLFWCSGFSLQ